jgi:hypothetical protein
MAKMLVAHLGSFLAAPTFQVPSFRTSTILLPTCKVAVAGANSSCTVSTYRPSMSSLTLTSGA